MSIGQLLAPLVHERMTRGEPEEAAIAGACAELRRLFAVIGYTPERPKVEATDRERDGKPQ
jgi:hypothetical protein